MLYNLNSLMRELRLLTNPPENGGFVSNLDANFNTILAFFFFAVKALNKGISQKKNSFIVILNAFVRGEFCYDALFRGSQ